ncbi:MAG: adenylate/guanylate cyclase domain-containing protein [Rhizobiaceae bacterium]|nr:adenylate/guanylate cyclase domain-containing protein [Rhizobiaceae bacterium]
MGSSTPKIPRFEGFIEQIVHRGLQGQSIEEQLNGLATIARNAGLPVKWVCITMRTLHPRFGTLSYIWRADTKKVDYMPQRRTAPKPASATSGQMNFMPDTGSATHRYRIDGNDKLQFPILEQLRNEGMTDYAASLVRYESGSKDSAFEGVYFSCATDSPAGFDTDNLQQVFDVLPYFAIAIKSRLTYDVASTVTKTYLGKDAGRRVLTGEIDRGSTQTIRAVIWYFDLQGFTQLAESTPGVELIAMLNEYFGVVVRAVESFGGDVLKFMGDGLLAVFKFADDESACCSRVIAATDELVDTMASTNVRRKADGLVHTDFSLALHIGELMYGNIGSEDRLDFTVIGPAVNMVARIQTMCRPLGHNIIVSSAMVQAIGREHSRIVTIGKHDLRGITKPEPLSTLVAPQPNAK